MAWFFVRNIEDKKVKAACQSALGKDMILVVPSFLLYYEM